MLAVKPILSRHVIAIDLPSKCQDIASYRAEPDMMHIDLTLNRTRLVRTFEVSGDSVAVLRDLDVLHNDLAVIDVRGIDRPVTFHVVRGLLGRRGATKNQRQ